MVASCSVNRALLKMMQTSSRRSAIISNQQRPFIYTTRLAVNHPSFPSLSTTEQYSRQNSSPSALMPLHQCSEISHCYHQDPAPHILCTTRLLHLSLHPHSTYNLSAVCVINPPCVIVSRQRRLYRLVRLLFVSFSFLCRLGYQQCMKFLRTEKKGKRGFV